VPVDLSPAAAIPAGSEVVTLDGMPIGDVITHLLAQVAFADGTAMASKYLELSRFFSAYYATFIRRAATYELAYGEPGCTATLLASVPGISYKVLLSWHEGQVPEQDPLMLTFPDATTALLTLRSFWLESKDVDLESFLRDAFQEIAARQVSHLIIDLRDNEGGKDAYGALLYAYLTDRPFRYYDRITVAQRRPFSFRRHAKLPIYFPLYRLLIARARDGGFVWRYHPNLRTQTPMANSYLGDVTVLINGRSFSVTSEFAAMARANGRATFVGQESGGGYRGNNSGFFAIVTLPNSRLVVGIPLWSYHTAVPDPEASDGGVRPDIVVSRRIEDVLAGHDRALAVALARPTCAVPPSMQARPPG
jgi:hypothetical protein